jgi:hypothetical protein
MRVWRGPGNRDSSDDDWEEEFRESGGQNLLVMDAQVDTRGMIRNAFQQNDNNATMENRIREEVLMAFTARGMHMRFA